MERQKDIVKERQRNESEDVCEVDLMSSVGVRQTSLGLKEGE